MDKFTKGMTPKQAIAYLDQAKEKEPQNLTFVDDCDYLYGSICIFPKGWKGGSVTIDYTQLDDLIQELIECKKYYTQLEEIRKKVLTNQKQYDII